MPGSPARGGGNPALAALTGPPTAGLPGCAASRAERRWRHTARPPEGADGGGKAQRPLERVAEPTGGKKRRHRSRAATAARLPRRDGAYHFACLHFSTVAHHARLCPLLGGSWLPAGARPYGGPPCPGDMCPASWCGPHADFFLQQGRTPRFFASYTVEAGQRWKARRHRQEPNDYVRRRHIMQAQATTQCLKVKTHVSVTEDTTGGQGVEYTSYPYCPW